MYRSTLLALLFFFLPFSSAGQPTHEVAIQSETDGTLGQTFAYELREEFRSSEFLRFVPKDEATSKILLYVRTVSTSGVEFSALSVSWVLDLPDKELYYGQNAVLLVPGQTPQVARTIAAQTETIYREARVEYEQQGEND